MSEVRTSKQVRPKHPLAGRTVRVNSRRSTLHGAAFRVVDWWDRVSERPWRECPERNVAAHYAARRTLLYQDLPDDDDVVIGRIDSTAYLLHASELGEPL